jgi:hypothetical protein
MIGEKRRFTRFPFKMRAELTLGDKTHELNEIDNLSIGGCLVSLDTDIDIGTSCILRIKLGTTLREPTITMGGTVVRCESEKLAIRFTQIEPDDLIHLQRIALYNSYDSVKVENEIREHPGLF